MAVLVGLLNLQFPKADSNWPTLLNIIPFVAQGRCLYLVLVYRIVTDQYITAMLIMAAQGTACLTLACMIENKDRVVHYILSYNKSTKSQIPHTPHTPHMAHTPSTKPPIMEMTARHSFRPIPAMKVKVSSEPMSLEEGMGGIDDGIGGIGGTEACIHTSSVYPPATYPTVTQPSSTVSPTTHSTPYIPPTVPLDVNHAMDDSIVPEASVRGGMIDTIDADCAREIELCEARVVVEYDAPIPLIPEGPAMVVAGLQYRYPPPIASMHRPEAGFLAVKELSLYLTFGEVFSLLGPNGAGKSTAISILSGQSQATAGRIYIAGQNIGTDANAIHKYVGICPQFDVIWEDLTVSDHLYFQARQRGIPTHLINAKVQLAAGCVGLDGDGFYTRAGQLSGGMRRRLSIAMSIVGDPPIIIMDEPTTGLDPDNRQQVWRIIQKLKGPSRLVLITTHSMEEAETLSTRIGIMARGVLRCLGSPQHLKNKFGRGFVLTVNTLALNSEEAMTDAQAKLASFVQNDLCGGHANAVALSAINRTTKFLIPKATGDEEAVNIGTIFQRLESMKLVLNIREWGLSMTSLEEIFVTIVSNADDVEE